MTDRRRRLLKHLYKKEERLFMFEQDLPQIIQMKKDVTHKFSAMQLEEFLCSNTKNVAHEVVTCLIAKKGEGVEWPQHRVAPMYARHTVQLTVRVDHVLLLWTPSMNFDLLLKLKSSYHSYIIRTALFFLQNDIIIIIYSTVYTVYILYVSSRDFDWRRDVRN